MHQGAALQAGEDGAVQGLLVLSLHQDHAATGAAQALVGGGGDHVRKRHGVGVHARGDQACVVGHVHPQNGANFLGDLGEALEVDVQGISRCASDDDAGLVLAGQRFHLFVVDSLLRVQAVRDGVEPLAGHVQRHAVGQVTAFGQAHAQDGVAGLGEGHQHGLVGLRA